MPLSEKTQERCRELLKYFYVPNDLSDTTKEIYRATTELPDELKNIVQNFTERLKSTIQTTATPYILANSAAHDKHFQRISMAARIRALKLEATEGETSKELDARRDKEARQRANENMAIFCASEEGVDAICLESAEFLLHLHSKGDVEYMARELLLQGTLAIWATLEMFIGDCLVWLVNSEPRLATKILTNSDAKRKFEPPKISAEYLSEKGFNLSDQMGSLLFAERDLSNLSTIKIACEAIFASDTLRQLLNANSLWLLNQKRHLIAHRRGVVDEEYIKNTGAKLSIGEYLCISTDEFEESMLGICAIAEEFLKCVSATLHGK